MKPIVVECKKRKKHSIVTLWDTVKSAGRQGRQDAGHLPK